MYAEHHVTMKVLIQKHYQRVFGQWPVGNGSPHPAETVNPWAFEETCPEWACCPHIPPDWHLHPHSDTRSEQTHTNTLLHILITPMCTDVNTQ